MSDWIDVKDEVPKISNAHLLWSRAMLVHAEGMNFIAVYVFHSKRWVALTEPQEYPDGYGMNLTKSEIGKYITHWKHMDVPPSIMKKHKESLTNG